MFGYEHISLNLSYPFVFLIIALLGIAAYSYYVYRYTIPPVRTFQKVILTSLRTLALFLLVFIFFEPILGLTNKEILKPVNLVFIDNSRSIKIDDGTNRIENVKQIVSDFSSTKEEDNFSFYQFGNETKEISSDSLPELKFDNGVTNISDIFSSIDKTKNNYTSITLITDGVYTAGDNPYYAALNTGIPVFTIGIGDTTSRKDIEVRKVLYNEIVYAENPTAISVTIQNKGFAGEKVNVSLLEDEKPVSTQSITLDKSGLQNVNFIYTPASGGEKKLSVIVSPLNDEFTTANNKRIFYVKVLTNKIKVVVLASSPSPDLTFIKNALTSDENISVISITQISKNKFLETPDYSLLDSADIFFLVGFPSQDTPGDLLNRVIKKITDVKIPYFLTLSSGINISRLTSLKSELPFTFGQEIGGTRQVQPEILPGESENPLLQFNHSNPVEAWNNLPPAYQLNVFFNPKPESKVLAEIKLNNKVVNAPLILTRNLSGRRSIAVLAKDIWKWKLQTVVRKSELFDSFIINSVRWLNAAEEQKPVIIKTSKKNYSQGERVEFSGNVFDESLNPVSDAEINIKISSGKNSYETSLQNIGAGIYEGTIVLNEAGNYNFNATVLREGTKLGEDKGVFNVGEIDLEMINPVMNYNLLNLIANETNGKFYTPGNYKEIFNRINELTKNSGKEKITTSEINLWSDEWLLVIAIILFSLEWFLRKRIGML